MAALAAAASALRAAASDLVASASTTLPTAALDGGALLVALKATTTSDVDALLAARARADAARAAADAEAAVLDALAYEARHCDREIEACAAFHSAYGDEAVDLAPVEEFWAEADEELQARARTSEHGLMLARLEHERRARLAALAGLQDARASRRAAETEAAAARSALAELAGDAAGVAAAVDAARERLRLPPPPAPGAAAAAAADAAARLPEPLYRAYAQLAGAAGGWPELTAVLRAAPADAPAGDATAVADPHTPAQGRVRLEFADGEATVFAADLAYLPALRILTAAPAPGPVATTTAAALATAFPDDAGDSLPTEAAAQLAGGDAVWPAAAAAAAGRPFRWLQALAGLDLHPADAGAPPPGVLGTLRGQTRGYAALRALRDAAVKREGAL